MTNSEQLNYKRLLFQKTIYIFFGKAMPVIILFLITIIYSGRLSYSDYGIFQSVWMYANIVNVIISFGLSSIILSTNLHFLFFFIKKEKNKIVTFYSVLTLSVLIIFFFFAKNFSVTTKLVLCFFMIIQNIVTVAETLLIKRGGEKKAFVINFFYSILFFACHLYFLYASYSLVYLITGVSIVSIIKLIVILLIPAIKENYKPEIDEKKFLKHWIYLGFNDIAGILAKWIDKMFLLYLLTSADFAIFFNGSFEIPLFGLLISVTGSFLLIEISANTKFTGKITALFRENFNMLSSVVFPLFFFLLFFKEEIFHFVLQNKYNASIPIFAISIFVLPARINNYSVILQCFSQGRKIMSGAIFDIIIAVILMTGLYPYLGTRGIALAIVIATWCQVIYYLWHSAGLLNISIKQLVPVKKLFVKFLILLAIYLLLSLSLQNSSIIVNLIISALVTMLLVLAGMWSYFKSFFKSDYVKDS